MHLLLGLLIKHFLYRLHAFGHVDHNASAQAGAFNGGIILYRSLPAVAFLFHVHMQQLHVLVVSVPCGDDQPESNGLFVEVKHGDHLAILMAV